MAVKAVVMSANSPAPFKFFHASPQRLRNDLVAKANAHHRARAGINLADQIAQRGDKGVILIGAMFGAGDQPSVCRVNGGGKISIHHVPGLEGEVIALKQSGKHSVEITVLGTDLIRRMATL